MKFLGKAFGVLVTLMMLTSAFAKSEKCHDKDGIVKFVQGGASAGGNGSKKHPFATLADAQNATWDTLIVLSSAVTLDGGITLTHGQKLIGEEDPTCLRVSPTQPTISNTTTANSSDGVVAIGDVTIKNIFFTNTNGNAIGTDLAENLTVENVRIINFNQNASLSSSGIGGNAQSSGETWIKNVIISNPSGRGFAGILESLSANSIHRKLSVCNCELSQLNQGIFIQLQNADATSTVDIENSYLHDFLAPTSTQGGILSNLNATDNQQTMRVKNSTFYHLGGSTSLGNEILAVATHNSQLKLQVDSCSFNEIASSSGSFGNVNGVTAQSHTTASFTATIERSSFTNINIAIQPQNFGNSTSFAQVKCATFNTVNVAVQPQTFSAASIIDTTVEKSQGTNVGTFFQPQFFTGGQQKNVLCGNTDTGMTFYNTNIQSGTTGTEQILIVGNTFNGLQAIQAQSPPTATVTATWHLLNITAKHNCFNGGNASGSTALLFQARNLGNIVVDAHENSFSEFNTDIRDGGTSTDYLVSRNFWGIPTVSCTATSMCGTYQTCKEGLCFGPTVSLPTTPPLFTGFIDPSNPLEKSIKCPCN